MNKNPLKGLVATHIKSNPSPNRHGEFRKEQYEEILNNKNILNSLIPNEISEKEEDATHQWWINHECFKKKEFWDHYQETWTPYPKIHLTPTSLGTNILVVCPVCKKQENVTDHGIW